MTYGGPCRLKVIGSRSTVKLRAPLTLVRDCFKFYFSLALRKHKCIIQIHYIFKCPFEKQFQKTYWLEVRAYLNAMYNLHLGFHYNLHDVPKRAVVLIFHNDIQMR